MAAWPRALGWKRGERGKGHHVGRGKKGGTAAPTSHIISLSSFLTRYSDNLLVDIHSKHKVYLATQLLWFPLQGREGEEMGRRWGERGREGDKRKGREREVERN